ncbi:Protein that coordinates expression of mitochondrially-encoded genes [Komagataella phaffii CBS 7435]|uniref:Mitochondrial membrane protein that coordinates expression of mitochondrially-encoded genes n=2 Tax=Komagataella phaffii TaxID=460519 RepID=C4QVQ3_KOMPG|nr:uncharacterized protein PAS_chr1-3_0262 [Komagataella phaffii GS115]AOA61462.1 GQ67_02525T0 [Komagataella phaffii]CAH2445983.1 Protein that coordinates expression of mitochondrially-encoded genes [Komagataella phaffii CBS 7435]AOA66645.1 GQ68_02722T0 [Komagataella phaffii GS115]CAY67326.1 Mitochondrial membrane protein that coordinates expression of mitochondrially-encoded genes [Komagataella phaffii GS115]CCA36429.1 Protein that coordinates expression of mitochondrially-encoded genes [Koma
MLQVWRSSKTFGTKRWRLVSYKKLVNTKLGYQLLHTSRLSNNEEQKFQSIIGNSIEELTESQEKVHHVPQESSEMQAVANGNVKKPPKAHKIIILKAEDSLSRNRRIFEKQLQPEIEPIMNLLDFESQKKQLLVFQTKVTEKVLIDSIHTMKPSDVNVSVNRFEQIAQDLASSYTLNQLRLYCQTYYNDQIPHKISKKKLITDIILSKHWNLQKTSSIDPLRDVITEKVIQLSGTRDLFLLLSSDGIILQHWAKTGATIAVSTEDSQLTVRATKATVDFIEVMLAKILEKKETQLINMSIIKEIMNDVHLSDFPLNQLMTVSNVHFKKIDDSDELFSMCSLGSNKIELAKRLLVAALNYRPNTTESVIQLTDKSSTIFFPYNESTTLPWNYHAHGLYRLRTPHKRVSQDSKVQFEPVGEDLVENLKGILEQIDQVEQEITKIEGLQEQEQIPHENNPDLSFDELEEIAYKDTNTELNNETDQILTEFQENGLSNKIDSTVSDLTIDPARVFSALSGINGTKNDVEYVASLGKVLFPNQNVGDDHYFQGHVPSIKQLVNSLPLFSQHDPSFSETQDSYDHYLRIKFLPSLFEKGDSTQIIESVDKDSLKKPPVEFWFPIQNHHEKKTVQIEGLQVVRVNQEKNVSIPLPSEVCDVRFSSNETTPIVRPNETSQDFSIWLKDQPGIREFLQNSTIALGSRLNLLSNVNIEIHGETVNYTFTEIEQRRQLELNYRQHLLQYSAVEGGLLGGKRTEVNLVNMAEAPATTESFAKFSKDVLDLVRILSCT